MAVERKPPLPSRFSTGLRTPASPFVYGPVALTPPLALPLPGVVAATLSVDLRAVAHASSTDPTKGDSFGVAVLAVERALDESKVAGWGIGMKHELIEGCYKNHTSTRQRWRSSARRAGA